VRIGLKISLGCLGLAALVGVVGWLSSLTHDAVRRDVRSLRESSLLQFEAATDMVAALKASHAAAQELVVEGWRAQAQQRRGEEPGGELERAALAIERRIATLAERLMTCRRASQTAPPDAGKVAALDHLEGELALHRARLDALIQLVQNNPQTAARLLEEHIEPHYRNVMRPLLQRYRADAELELDSKVADIDSALATSDWRNQLVAFAACGLAVALALLLTRSIARPIRLLAVAARRIGSGDLDARVRAGGADEVGQLASSFNHMASRLQRSMVSKSDVDDILRSMGEILLVSDSSDRIRTVNRAAVEQLGWSEAELVGRDVHDIVHAAEEAGELQIVTRDGAVLPVACTPTDLNDERGQSRGRVWIAQNILHQKMIERQLRSSIEEKEVLLREVHHRVKNNLQVICSLLKLQASDADGTDVARRLEDSERRVRTMALIHEQLYRSGDLARVNFAEYVEALAKNVVASAGSSGRSFTLHVDVEPIALDLDVAILCGLILNELLANALKHAFPQHRQGAISVRFERRDRRAILSVADDGVGMAAQPAAPSTLGLRLVRAFARQLGADTTLEDTQGTRVTVAFDVPGAGTAPMGMAAGA
jgi:two-component sensor histidine kinase/HAMP domain-containing protein